MAKQKTQASKRNEEEAYKIALGIQRPEQTKEQTKLIAQGISKGIELYKKQQKAKTREIDKSRKKALKSREQSQSNDETDDSAETRPNYAALVAWLLLAGSWIGFAIYLSVTK